jgi:chemosensory pili system protein ChpC
MAGNEIRTIMAPLSNGSVLLPNSAVAEVLDFTRPEPFKQGPAWLLGELSWRGWQLPVISYEQLLDENAAATSTSKARILIIKTLGESTQVNYIGLLIQGLPRLKKVTGDSLIEKQTVNLPETLFSKVSIDDQEALIPEIADLTRVVEQAAYDS